MMPQSTPIRRDGHIVITGGAGFLGTNLADALAQRGNDVVIFDNLSRDHVEKNLRWLKDRHPDRVCERLADIRDAETVKDSIRGAHAVIHLAAQVAVTASIADPVADFDINARGTLNVLEAIRAAAPDALLLFASTNKVYGKLLPEEALTREGLRYVPLDSAILNGFGESTPLSLYSPYGCSKGAADQYVLDYARIYGLQTTVFRMSCLYGPHQYGTEDQGWVAHFAIAALRGKEIVVYGDGYQVRDVLFVDDAVRAYLLALKSPDAVTGRAFNLGGGRQNILSLRELLSLLERLNGRRPDVRFQPWRPGDQHWYVSDTSAFAKACAWQPRVDLETGLSRLYQWLRAAIAHPESALFQTEAAA